MFYLELMIWVSGNDHDSFLCSGGKLNSMMRHLKLGFSEKWRAQSSVAIGAIIVLVWSWADWFLFPFEVG